MATTTGLDLIKGALKLIGVLAEGETPSADQSTDALARLNEFVDALDTHPHAKYTTTRTTATLTAETGTYTIGSGGTLNQVRPDAIEAAAIIPVGESFEIPVTVISAASYAALSLKSQTSVYPYALYYSPASPLGTVIVYPTPTTAATLVLYVRTALATFADLSTSYTLPKGWQRMLRYNLAKILAPEYGRPLDPAIDEAARESLADVKRTTIGIDPVASGLFSGGGIYDINSDEVR